MQDTPLDPYARPPGGQPSAGIATGDEKRYADGFKAGDVVYRFGTKESVVRDRPGWFVADGTQPDLIIAGVTYGKPNLTKRVIMGADGVSVGFLPGNTGGSDGVPAHLHAYTHENEHGITQPVFSSHGITQPVFAAPGTHAISSHAGMSDHGDHTSITWTEFTATGLAVGVTGVYAMTKAAGAGVHVQTFVHSNNHSTTPNRPSDHTSPLSHTPDPLTRSTDVALSNNSPNHNRATDVALTNNVGGHTGGAVGAVTSPSSGNYPPYVAVWPLIKVYE